MYVYFIRSGKKGAIKIGKTSDLNARQTELQVGNPNQLFMLGFIRCGNEKVATFIEKRLHKIFRKERIRGEWFYKNIKLKGAINDKEIMALMDGLDDSGL